MVLSPTKTITREDFIVHPRISKKKRDGMFSQSFAFLEDGLNRQVPHNQTLPLPQNRNKRDRSTDGAPSSSQHGGGGMFKTNIFGTTKRPGTSGGVKTKDFQPQQPTELVPGQLTRKTSFRDRFNSTPAANLSPEKRRPSIQHIDNSAAELQRRESEPRQSIGLRPKETPSSAHSISRRDSQSATTLPNANMLARPGTSYSTYSSTGGPGLVTPALPSPTLENITYLHIHETSSKRISTLDYLRKAHEGRVYWFNTLLFNKPDLQRMPYFDSRKLARRATNYLLLGLSLPTVLDLNSANPTEFLRTLNALLTEFEAFQSIHPPDGSSSLSRGRFPQMFKRATTSAGKGRRTSSAAEIGLPMGNDSYDSKSTNGPGSGGANASFLMGETDLLPGEEYTHLLTPSLPFDPDFYETFATLCDVLIDCYTKLMGLVSGPRECSPYIAEMFTKADAKVRKILVQGVVKEFEDSSRAGVKGEIAGIGKVVLGGLM